MRVGVVGVGRHASRNIYPSMAMAGLEIVATCARHQGRADAAAARWGAPHAFDSAEKMLASVDLDGVVICVEPPEYAPLVELCLQAGKPVFCEKPGASSSVKASELERLSAITAVPVVVGYMKRFAPAYRRAHALMRSQEFGPPSLGTFTFAMGPWAVKDLRGYLIDNPVHHLDLGRYFLGELTGMQAYFTELPGAGDAVAVIARGSSGAVCSFNFCTTASWEQRNEYAEIYGQAHSVWVENVDTCTYRPPERPELVWRPNYTVPSENNSSQVVQGFVPALKHFREVVAGDAENLSDMASAAATLALAERLHEIATEGID
jgi:UDP-N-acetylglucosamine 3-dehydrogenase